MLGHLEESIIGEVVGKDPRCTGQGWPEVRGADASGDAKLAPGTTHSLL